MKKLTKTEFTPFLRYTVRIVYNFAKIISRELDKKVGLHEKYIKLKAIFVVFSVLLLYNSTAHAYLDAGTGSMLLQLLLGGLAGFAVLVKLFWRKILGLFGIRKSDNRNMKSSAREM